jgi:hypothetical protein
VRTNCCFSGFSDGMRRADNASYDTVQQHGKTLAHQQNNIVATHFDTTLTYVQQRGFATAAKPHPFDAFFVNRNPGTVGNARPFTPHKLTLHAVLRAITQPLESTTSRARVESE